MNSTASTGRSNVERPRDRLVVSWVSSCQSAEVAGDRPELFVGAGVQTPADGIKLLPEHRSSTVVMRFDPIRGDDGSLRVDHLLPNSPTGREMAASVRSGKTPGLSVEFHSLDEARVSGVREVRQSLVTAVATVPAGAYAQATAEVRAKGNHRRVLTWL